MTGQIQFVLIKDKQTCLVIDKWKSVRLWFVAECLLTNLQYCYTQNETPVVNTILGEIRNLSNISSNIANSNFVVWRCGFSEGCYIQYFTG